MAEVNELFVGWDEHPPTNILVKAFVGWGKKEQPLVDATIPPEALEQMQRSALAAISAKAGNRLPIIKGKDKGLPKVQPTFDLDELRRRNAQRNVRLK